MTTAKIQEFNLAIINKMSAGMTVDAAIDFVMGQGTYELLVDLMYANFRASAPAGTERHSPV